MKKFFYPFNHNSRISFGLLALRVLAGTAMMFHGWGKIQNPFGWMPPEAGIPGFFQFLAALSEFGGGLALIIGLLVPLASLGIACTMAVAMFTHISRGDPFVGQGGPSWEPASLFFVIAVLLITTGAGKFSLDSKVFKS